ncbi:hypothetical protein LTR08_000916 [Meristemomyces frigidus]|nr:hypothetical protein LTR08_000916 [Meristemomyces frigidus]
MAPNKHAQSPTKSNIEPLDPGEEVILATFGELEDGLNVDKPTAAVRVALPLRYDRRGELAELSRQAEGQPFQIQLLGGQVRNVLLITPPNHVAEERDDGSWVRRIRDEEQDGTSRYSSQWYIRYLRQHGLPNWFLQPEHVAMLEDDAEDMAMVELSNEVVAVEHSSDERSVNPDTQPEGEGRWEYLTDVTRELAWLNFGGQEGFGFGDVAEPSAHDIWRLRQRYRARIAGGEAVEDFTAGNDGNRIDVVWIPARPAPPAEDDVPATPTAGGQSGEVDARAAEVHEPFNRGENDQTAPSARARYETRLLPVGSTAAKKVTVDRGFCRVGEKELWKTAICKGDGEWVPYPKLANLDWNNKKQIAKLNAWRDRAYANAGWTKRFERRIDYNEDERKWVFERVRKAGGSKLGAGGKKALLVDFNAKLTKQGRPERFEAGLTGVVSRLGQMLRKYGTYQAPRGKRGANLTAKHQAVRDAKRKARQSGAAGVEGSEEEAPRPEKKAKKSEQSVEAESSEEDEEDEENGSGEG